MKRTAITAAALATIVAGGAPLAHAAGDHAVKTRTITAATPLAIQRHVERLEAKARNQGSVPASLTWDGRYRFGTRQIGSVTVRVRCFEAPNLTGSSILVGAITVRPGASFTYCVR
jgi:hypothetical protein